MKINSSRALHVNSFPNDKILNVTKLKFAKMTNSVFDRVENTAGKGENAGS